MQASKEMALDGFPDRVYAGVKKTIRTPACKTHEIGRNASFTYETSTYKLKKRIYASFMS